MSIENAIASLAVNDMAAAVAWYEALFERAADSTPMQGVAEWKFPRGGWLQVYALPERAGKGSLTLAVRDIDTIEQRVTQLGIATGRRTSTAKVRTLTVADPDGNQITFAEAIDTTMAR